MIYTPRPYQRLMLRHMLDTGRCGLWAGMGLGKTSVSLEAVSVRLALGDIRKALVIAPKRVARSTWPNEAQKWENFRHLRVVPVIGTRDERLAALSAPADIHTINYDNLPWLVQALKGAWPYDLVIADESTRLKSLRVDARVSKSGKKFLRSSGGSRAGEIARVAFQSGTWSNLTGTPSPNGLQDLWGQTWFLDRGDRLGSTYGAFTNRWFRPGWNGYGIEPLAGAKEQITERLSDICLSLEAKDHFDLPPLVESTIRVTLPPAARNLYREMERSMFMEIDGHEIEAGHAASRTLKCLQLASGAVYTDDKGAWVGVHDEKLDALEEVIAEAAGSPVLVAIHFKSDWARIQKRCKAARYLDDDPKTEADWNAGRIPLLVAHPASAGHGLNLQDGGHHLVFFSHWWDYEQWAQIIERIGPTRQAQSGYNRPVFITYIVAADTADELVFENRAAKEAVHETLMRAAKRSVQKS